MGYDPVGRINDPLEPIRQHMLNVKQQVNESVIPKGTRPAQLINKLKADIERLEQITARNIEIANELSRRSVKHWEASGTTINIVSGTTVYHDNRTWEPFPGLYPLDTARIGILSARVSVAQQNPSGSSIEPGAYVRLSASQFGENSKLLATSPETVFGNFILAMPEGRTTINIAAPLILENAPFGQGPSFSFNLYAYAKRVTGSPKFVISDYSASVQILDKAY